jgi:hypothetical protein
MPHLEEGLSVKRNANVRVNPLAPCMMPINLKHSYQDYGDLNPGLQVENLTS